MYTYYEKVRIYPNKFQKELITKYLDINRGIYNDLVYRQREALHAYALAKKNNAKVKSKDFNFPKYKDETKALTVKRQGKRAASCPQMFQAMTLKRAFNAFKAREKGSELRFKKKHNFKTITLNGAVRSVKIGTNKIKLNKDLGYIRVRKGREIPNNFTLCSIHVKNNKYYFIFNCKREAKPLASTGKSLGIDLGITNIIATSEGSLSGNPRYRKNAQKRLAALQQQAALEDNKNKETNIRIARLYERCTNQMKNYFHKLALKIVRENDVIVLEDLELKKMKENGSKTIKKGFQEVALATFRKYLIEKAESANRKVILVNPAYTSQQCWNCKRINKKNRNGSHFQCLRCGYTAHADTNAAKNILFRGVGSTHEGFKYLCGKGKVVSGRDDLGAHFN